MGFLNYLEWTVRVGVAFVMLGMLWFLGGLLAWCGAWCWVKAERLLEASPEARKTRKRQC
jgi:hypothetical protein